MTITAPDGAYIIGGGEYHFGQAVTEDLARAAFEFPMPNLGNMVELLRSVLELLPLDVLKPFKDFLGLDDAHFGTVIDAVNNIISSLQQRPIFMLLTDFTSWVKDLVQAITGVAGGDLSMLTTWFKSNVVDQIAGVVKVIQDLLDGLFGLFGISGVTGKTPLEVVAAIGTWLSGVFQPVSDGLTTIVKTVTDLIEGFFNLFGGSGTASLAGMLSFATNWMTVTFKGVSDGLASIVKMVQDLFDGIWRLFTGNATGVGKDLTATLAAISGWLTGVFKPVADGLTAIVKIVQDLLDGLFGLFGVSGATGKTPLEVITAIGTWLTGVFQPISDGLTAIVKTVTDLIDGFFNLFGGTGTGTLADMISAATSWMTHWQEFVDGIWSAFSGGVAGAGKTVADALAAVTGWFGGVFQKLIDGINALASLIPGFSTGSNPIQNAVDIISGILGVGESAAASAANANAGLAAIEAGQKGGFFDEFELPLANDLPVTDWKKTSTLADSYGPDGHGSAEFKPAAHGLGWTDYVQISKPLLVPDMRCGVTLSKLPAWDALVRSAWRIKVQCNPTDKACLEVQIENTQARFYTVDAAGNGTALGSSQSIPANALGTQYELEIKGNVLTLFRGGIQVATYSGVTPKSGRCVGVGAK